MAGGLEEDWAATPARGSPDLTRDERKLLAFLEAARGA